MINIKKNQKKIKHFGHGEGNNGRIYDQRKWNVDAMDVGLMDVWIEDSLWHDNAKPHELNKKLNLLQEQKIQHGLITKHNA